MRFPDSLAPIGPKVARLKIPSIMRQEPILWPMLLLLALIYIVPHTAITTRVQFEISRHYNSLPELNVDFHPSRTFANRFSTNKTVLYIETRNEVSQVTPLLLHMTQVIPPEWRFVFIGTEDLVRRVNQSSPIKRMVDIGKLRLGHVEQWTHKWQKMPEIGEVHSRLLTNMTFYDEQLPGVEWLLVFRSSAIICANAARTVNDYLEYDWVGAPWNLDAKFGGNGGLSLRRISRIREVLQFQQRLDDTASEDQWLSGRIGLLPAANPANATVEQGFAVEDVWAERPLGYHINPVLGPGGSGNVWVSQERRKLIFDYCPEAKIIMHMRLERERCSPEQSAELDDPEGGIVKRSIRGKLHLNKRTHREKSVMDAVEAGVELIDEAGPQDSPKRLVEQVLHARALSKSDL